MTDEWIVEKAKEAGKREGVFSDLVHSPKSRGVNSAYGIGFIDGMVEYRGSLWHDASELPDLDTKIVTLREGQCVSTTRRYYEHGMKEWNPEKWCYFEDILPPAL